MSGIFDKLGDWNQVILILLVILLIVVIVFAVKGLIWVIVKVWNAMEKRSNSLKQYAQKTELGQKILHVILLIVGVVIVCITIAVNIRSCLSSRGYDEDEEYIQYEHRPDRY